MVVNIGVQYCALYRVHHNIVKYKYIICLIKIGRKLYDVLWNIKKLDTIIYFSDKGACVDSKMIAKFILICKKIIP